MNRSDKRRIHEKTKAALAKADEIIFYKDEEIKYLKARIAELERETGQRDKAGNGKKRHGWWS